LNARGAEQDRLDYVRAEVGLLDDCLDSLAGSRFDLILSTCAVYYAKDATGLMCALSALLNPGGQLFVSVTGAGTNRQMINVINGLMDDPSAAPRPWRI
jgi:predicted TPR repeat methyltransferase